MINHLPTGAGFLPSTVSFGFFVKPTEADGTGRGHCWQARHT